MEPYEDDDDTHFCIKCHLTITGLENYVRHRQSGCRPPETKQSEVTAEPPSTPTTVTYPEILNADAFFSSLELQSSAKSNPPLRSRGLVEKERKTGRTDDKIKKKPRRGQEPDESGLKEKLLNMPPVVADLDDLMDHLGIPSLVGFPDIVSAPGAKSSTAPSGKSACTPPSTKLNSLEHLSASPVESIITSSKGCNDRKGNEDSQRIEQDHAEWLDDTILVDLDTNSANKTGDHGELTSYADYDYQQDEESDEDSHDDDIDDIESSSNDDETDDRGYSPRGLTGGKWKPSDLLNDMSRLNEDEFIEDEDNPEPPLPLNTGGKWKPADSSDGQKIEENEFTSKNPGASSLEPSVTTERRPPPGHTRGKWIPGAPGDFGSGYWCNPCGRKLASRLLYNRHLLSDLHARRSIQEIDGDLQLPRGVGPLLRRKPASKRQRALAKIKSRSKTLSQEEEKVTRRKSRRRQKEVLSCEMCHARVRRPQMGKHLLSHYHCRVAGTNPCSNPAARRFILENMSNVVRQCPFQCSICRFYCNTEATFLRHWRSKLHASKFDDDGGRYKCTPCDFYCEKNNTMEQHLTSLGHREVVAMMNGSVPVVVGRQRYLVCETCNQRFRYNLQLRFHARETGHRVNVTATDEYQSKITCDECYQVVKSLVALQRHQLSCHKQKEDSQVKDDLVKIVIRPSAPYFCSFCTMNFTTAQEAIIHRRTSSHKETVRAQKFTTENSASVTRDCPHCGTKQATLLEHKEHLLQRHPELCHRCPRCGTLFALPQDVTRHTRDKECARSTDEFHEREPGQSGNWRCTSCPFVTDSQAEFVFHDALHAGSIEVETDEAGCSKAPAKYRCPLCEKLFCKVTLRNHIRGHTGERPFRCFKCSQSFSRRSSLNIHRKECSSSSSSFSTWHRQNEAKSTRHRNHACSECNASFYTNRYATRWVSYRETYKKRTWGIFVKTATRRNYRQEHYIKTIYMEECCTGYRLARETPLSCDPECESTCPHGICTRPNVCICFPGYRQKLIGGASSCASVCNGSIEDLEGCGDHARCIAPDWCVCHDGYTRTNATQHPSGEQKKMVPCVPKCDPECGTNAYCHEPNKCRCNDGYVASSSDDSVIKCSPVCEKECINGICSSPRVCSCLPGYRKHPTDNFVCEPVCDKDCVNASCIKPNHCECHEGYKKNPLDPPELCSPVCDPSCVNGNCVEPHRCQCWQGFQKILGLPTEVCSPVCDPPCLNGQCARPDECECHVGYEKDPHSAPNVCLPICNPRCVNADCTRPNYCECHHKYQANVNGSTGLCLPICDPPCVNGICALPDVCECNVGYGKDPNGSPQVCSPVCERPCVNADCTRPNQCECHHRYEKNPTVSKEVCLPVCNPECINARCSQPDKCECHEGYKKYLDLGIASHICSPSCDPPCVNADCTRPNHCECHHRYQMNRNGTAEVCLPICDPPCVNGTCTQPDICECIDGYGKDPNGPPQVCSPVCDPPCINADCTRPNQCECHLRYKMNPEASTEICWPICDPPCLNGLCTHPDNCECTDGFENKAGQASHLCLPVCDPPCINSNCTQPNHCECHYGYTIDATVGPHTCSPVCDDPCVNGFCHGPNRCKCHDGYKNNPPDPPQKCSPVCDPYCGLNAHCESPNKCACNVGYVVTTLAMSSSMTNKQLTTIRDANSTSWNSVTCEPVCEPECNKNASCIEPNFCQCNPGYASNSLSDQMPNPTQCFPVCEKDCVNGFCGYPNRCICHLGYKPSPIDAFTCEPVCQYDCINAYCTKPNYCECREGYTKPVLIPIGEHEGSTIPDNLCIPSCHEDCLNGSCIAPNQCVCYSGYVLKESSTNSSWKSCQPLCEAPCSSGSECVGPNQCQSQTQRNNESLTNLSDMSNVLEDCPADGNFYNNNGTCTCKNGWSGLTCAEPSFCIMSFTMAGNETAGKSSISLRHALRQHTMRHAGKNYKCGLPGCPTVLRTENELKSHRLLVHETGTSDRHFRCNKCPYAAKTRTQLRRHQTRHESRDSGENCRLLSCPQSHCNFTTKLTSHLRRHIRLHTGTKPYKCRHCSYASNNLENLRKHVLSTSLHPGKTIYECGVCSTSNGADPYRTNFAKELRAHLLEAHPRDFPRPSDASDHVAKIFRNDGEPASPPSDATSPYEDAIAGQTHDHEYNRTLIPSSTESK